jgi:hypothetical protein
MTRGHWQNREIYFRDLEQNRVAVVALREATRHGILEEIQRLRAYPRTGKQAGRLHHNAGSRIGS